jgi:hypothetical protein
VLWDNEAAGKQPSRVTWEIEPQAGGWTYVLSGLKTLLETGEPLAAPTA